LLVALWPYVGGQLGPNLFRLAEGVGVHVVVQVAEACDARYASSKLLSYSRGGMVREDVRGKERLNILPDSLR